MAATSKPTATLTVSTTPSVYNPKTYHVNQSVYSTTQLLNLSPPKELAKEVSNLFKGCFSMDITGASLNIFEVGKLLKVAYAAGDGQPCQTHVTHVLSDFQDGMALSIRATDKFAHSAIRVLSFHRYAWLEKDQPEDAIKELKKIGALAREMEAQAEKLVAMVEQLIVKSLAAGDQANSDRALAEEERKKIEALIQDSKIRQAALKKKSELLQSQIKIVEARQRELERKAKKAAKWGAISSIIGKTIGMAANIVLLSAGVPPVIGVGAIPHAAADNDGAGPSSGLPNAAKPGTSIGSNQDFLKEIKKTLELKKKNLSDGKKKLAELQEKLILLQGELKGEEAKDKPDATKVNDLKTTIALTESQIKTKEKEIKDKDDVINDIIKKMEEFAKEQADNFKEKEKKLEASLAELQKQAVELARDYIDSETELAKEVASLKEYSVQDDKLGMTISSLSIVVKTMVGVKATFAEIKLFWQRLADHYEMGSTTIEDIEDLARRNVKIFESELERSGNQWLILGQANCKAKELFTKAFQLASDAMRTLPSADECARTIKDYEPTAVTVPCDIIELIEEAGN